MNIIVFFFKINERKSIFHAEFIEIKLNVNSKYIYKSFFQNDKDLYCNSVVDFRI